LCTYENAIRDGVQLCQMQMCLLQNVQCSDTILPSVGETQEANEQQFMDTYDNILASHGAPQGEQVDEKE